MPLFQASKEPFQDSPLPPQGSAPGQLPCQASGQPPFPQASPAGTGTGTGAGAGVGAQESQPPLPLSQPLHPLFPFPFMSPIGTPPLPFCDFAQLTLMGFASGVALILYCSLRTLIASSAACCVS